MVDAQHYDLATAIDDSVQHAVGPPSCGVDAREFSAQRLADPGGRRHKWTREKLDHCCGDGFGKLPLDGGLREESGPVRIAGHRSWAQGANRLGAPHDVAPPIGSIGLPYVSQRLRVAEHCQGLFEFGKVFRAKNHGSGTTVARDRDALMLSLDAINNVAEVISDLAKRMDAHGHNCGVPAGFRQRVSTQDQSF